MIGGLIAGGLGALGSILGGNATKKAAERNAALANAYKKEGLGYIDQGAAEAKGYLGDVGNIWAGLTEQSGGLSGLQMYANALGLNGAKGNAAATGAFQAGPGYQFAMDQGLDALSRTAAAQGRLQSGQTGIDTMNYAQNRANQEYNTWLGNVGNFGNTQAGLYTTGLGGQAGSLSDLASLATGTAGQKVGLIGDVTSSLMGANNQKAAGTQNQISGGLSGLGRGLGSLFGGYI